MIARRTLIGALAGALAFPAAARAAPAGRGRASRMGVTRWPPDLTLEAVAAVDRFIAAECDMAAPMLLGGVPWTEAANESPFSANLKAELAWRPPAGHKLLLSLGPLDMTRRSVAPYWGERDNQPIPAPFAGRAFDDAQVKTAFARFAVRACEAMRPDWLAIGIETNALITNAPGAWPAYKALHRHAYERVKARFPHTNVCFTIEALHYLGHHTGADRAAQRREVLELMSHCDLVAFSIYPHMSWAVKRPLPDGFFDFAHELAEAAGGKPIRSRGKRLYLAQRAHRRTAAVRVAGRPAPAPGAAAGGGAARPLRVRGQLRQPRFRAADGAARRRGAEPGTDLDLYRARPRQWCRQAGDGGLAAALERQMTARRYFGVQSRARWRACAICSAVMRPSTISRLRVAAVR